ncbi:MAG: 2-polyprenyl-3-methyl-5-hydroxy-6-metoxy-1,4-ben zoquinolmethylase [uncultured bacterium]|nr:MAG: 2-polyprenyl-3-methyl-5-hydroxy-6-metoxy-1,4-ben zoquinolmethylase [uncultured bacterium]HBH18526.1 class I SAM-dependent methyltransferase [Cyanobacteria bacterium UBA9579]
MNCRICNNQTITIYDRQFDINYYNCINCDYIFIDPESIVSKEEELRIYQLHHNSLENTGYVNMFKDFADKAIMPYKSSTKSILDFGSGPSPVLAHLLREEGFEVDIYDPYFAPEKVYENKVYDLITSTEVIEHLSNPVETFKILYKHLNPSGIISIMTLYHPQDNEKFQSWWYRRDETHISFYTHNTMKHLAKIFNMEILLLDSKNLCVLQKRPI